MLVVATAGHVDHGKSTLVRALTGTDPDRLPEEQRRGLTIELGYAWTGDVTFVDVPGHERYVATMLAGLGPVPAALLVIAADDGWRAQTEEHFRAIDLLGVRHVLPVVTRSDLADPSFVASQTFDRVGVRPVCVSAVTGAGLAELRRRLDDLVRDVGAAPDEGRPRLWVDRVFAMPGAGTVVTGTLAGGALAVGDEVSVDGRRTTVRGLQSRGADISCADPGTRVAVSLRGSPDVRRGSAVVRADRWRSVPSVDVMLVGAERHPLPADVVLHVGSAAVAARLRPLGTAYARLTLREPLPLRVGDRGLLRHAGGLGLVAGVDVVDLDPPELRRRGAAAARAVELQTTSYAERRGLLLAADLDSSGAAPEPLISCGRWVAHPSAWARLTAAVAELARTDDGITLGAAASRLDVPDPSIVIRLAADAEVRVTDGRLVGTRDVDPNVTALREQLARDPFDKDAPTLPPTTAAIAHRHGLVLRLNAGVCLMPDALDVAVRRLAPIPQPFTVGAARDAMATSRRIAVPVLEALDAAGRTTKHADGRRTVVTAGQTE